MNRILSTSCLIALALATTVVHATQIADGIELIPGRFVPGTQPDGNSVVLRGARGLIVVDTGRHREHTQAVIDFAARLHLPIEAIVNTHWHLDHIGGNVLLRKVFPDVKVYASAELGRAREEFLDHYREQLVEAIAKSTDAAQKSAWQTEIELLDSDPAVAPDVAVDASGEREIAGRRVDLELERYAVTAGDVWLFDPATRVLVSGDLVTLPVPLMDTACPERWKSALARLAQRDFSVLVPGHGAPMQRREFDLYRVAFDRLLACAASALPKDACIEGWMKDASPLLSEESPKFVRSALGYYIDNSLRGDAARNAKLCGQ